MTVSIHAPTRGATRSWIDSFSKQNRRFNPRTHTGCDIRAQGSPISATAFQSTHPHGVRPAGILDSRHLSHAGFNPRTHTGCDAEGEVRFYAHPYVSIHAPTRGATLIFPFNPYSQISAIAPQATFIDQLKLFLFLAVVISVFGKIYSMFTLWCKDFFTRLKHPPYMKMLYLLIIAYTISLTEIDLTGGGEQFLIMQAMHGYHPVLWIAAMMLIHLIFTSLSFSSGLPGGNFIPTLVTGGLFGQIIALLLVKYGFIETESISYIMLISMVGFLVAVVRTPLTGIVLITEITGHLDVFYPSIIVGGLTYYFTEMLQIKPFNVVLYDEMISTPAFRAEGRSSLFVEIMTGAYFDGKEVDHLTLPQRCIIKTIHRDRKDLAPAGQTLIPGDQVEIEIDSQDIEKLYEPLVSMANIY